MKRLRAAGYLADQMVGAPTASWDETHYAIWSLFSASVTAPSDPAAATTLRNAALTFAQNNPNSFGSWNVLIDNNAYNTSYSGPIVQAYITKSAAVVPEPSTYLLTATGLVALGIAARRRRRRGNRPAAPGPD
ncbi:MAG: PEP-CTERM sorting domain-containing protein [Gemmatimonadetes bacterium]|nr:PEP-CTERM sorting domain-containing protein [Gemmatimonadota bacterium]